MFAMYYVDNKNMCSEVVYMEKTNNAFDDGYDDTYFPDDDFIEQDEGDRTEDDVQHLDIEDGIDDGANDHYDDLFESAVLHAIQNDGVSEDELVERLDINRLKAFILIEVLKTSGVISHIKKDRRYPLILKQKDIDSLLELIG